MLRKYTKKQFLLLFQLDYEVNYNLSFLILHNSICKNKRSKLKHTFIIFDDDKTKHHEYNSTTEFLNGSGDESVYLLMYEMIDK